MKKKLEKEWYVIVAYMVVVMIVTRYFIIPLPSGGYFNFGDVFVVFSGLMLGHKGGAIAGGLGAAAADLISGYAVFAPLTLVSKGLEGWICGFAKDRHGIFSWIIPGVAGLVMATVYFVGESLMPSIKLQGALLEILPNLTQAAGGAVGGRMLFEIYNRASAVNKQKDVKK